MYSIAIVDDNEAWSFTLGFFLHQHNFSVSSFNDPEAFLKRAQEFDLALVDFSIPSRRYQQEIDGPGLITRLKRQLISPPLLVLISAYFTEEILQHPGDLCPEADAYLSKGFELKDILRCIERLLAEKAENQESSVYHRRYRERNHQPLHRA